MIGPLKRVMGSTLQCCLSRDIVREIRRILNWLKFPPGNFLMARSIPLT